MAARKKKSVKRAPPKRVTLKRAPARKRASEPSPQQKRDAEMVRRGAMLALSGAYRAASKDRIYSNWLASSGSSDATLLDDLPVLRERSRDVIRNDSLAASIVRVIVDNVVGTGLRPQSRIDAEALGLSEEQAEAFQHQAESIWRKACKYLDASGRTDFLGLQGLVARKLVEDGEIFAIPTMVRDPNRPLETAVDVIEADRVDTPEGREDEFTRAGVIHGRRGQPVAYWIADQHPGDVGLAIGSTRETTYRKVFAWNALGRRQVLHSFVYKRPQQTRGEPMLAAVLDDIKDLQEYEEAIRVRARVEACIAGFVQTEDPGLAALSRGNETDINGSRIEMMEPGRIEYLAPGQSINFSSPVTPGGTFEPYVIHSVRRIGAGIGLPLELILCDFSKTNYSSARASLLEARRFFRRLQNMIIERFCQPIWEAVLEEAWAKSMISAPTFLTQRDEWTNAVWIAPAYGWIDPTKEVQASTLAIEGGLSTLAEECAAQGRDADDVHEQLVRERRRRIRDGVGLDVEEFARGVRSGMLTPQADDEDFVREALALPAMSEDVRSAWAEEGGARRPITLTQPADEKVPGVNAPAEADVTNE